MKKLALLLSLLLAILLAAPSLNAQSVGASQIKKKTNAGLVADSANALAVGVYRGATAPASPVAGQLWFDTTTTPATLKTWNGSAWESPPSATAVTLADFSSLPATPSDGQIVWASSLKRAVVYDASASKWYYLDQSGREAVADYSLDAAITSDFLTPAAVTGTVAAGGSVTIGTHVCAMTYYNATGGDTMPGAATATLTASSGQQTLSLSFPATVTGASGKRVWCSKAGQTTPLWLVATIDDTTTATYDVTVADGSFNDDTSPDVDFSASVPAGWTVQSMGRSYGGCGSTGTSLLCATYVHVGSLGANQLGVRLTYEVTGAPSGWRAQFRLARATRGFNLATGNAYAMIVGGYVAGDNSTASNTARYALGPRINSADTVIPYGIAGWIDQQSRAVSADWTSTGVPLPAQYRLTFATPMWFSVDGWSTGSVYGGRLSASTNARDWTHGTPWSIATEMKHVGTAHESTSTAVIGSLVTEIDQFTVQSF
jgi:hypothetical protein